MLRRAAADIEPGMTVNLGVGLPTQVVQYLPDDFPICIHSENGIAGVGTRVDCDVADRNVTDASGGYVSLVPGASYFDSAVSFALVRSGRIDMTFLGAFQVAANGDLANWTIPGSIPAGIGGAIELAQKSRQVGVITTHVDKHGKPKILNSCTVPLTAAGCVRRIYTDMAVLDVRENGLHVVEIAEGIDFSEVARHTGAPLFLPDGLDEGRSHRACQV